MGTRALKETLRTILAKPIGDQELEKICTLPLRKVINPLFSFFYSGQEMVRWNAVTAMGAVTSRLAALEMEHARIVMRRLMWNLNDESGGIGWGSPEAMGEIMARCAPLAYEYGAILISYTDPNGNFIEHDKLQRGVLWGVGRLAQPQPRLAGPAAPFLPPYLTASDPYLRGLALWAAGNIGSSLLVDTISALTQDFSKIIIFENFRLRTYTLSELAQQFLSNISTPK
jgi:hypothetical protein